MPTCYVPGMTPTQIELDLDDPRAVPVAPPERNITVGIKIDLALQVDVAKLAFEYRKEIAGEATTKILDREGYGESERFEVWLHYFLFDRLDTFAIAPSADGVHELWGAEPEVNFRLNDEDRVAIEGGLEPRWAIPTD